MIRLRQLFATLTLVCLVSSGGSAYAAQSLSDPVADALGAVVNTVPTPPIAFVGIAPCRLVDTRTGSGFTSFFGPPSMAALASRFFPVAGNCGIPLSAQAVSANMVVTNTSGTGFISVWPGGDPQPSPLVASINFSTGQTIANAVLAPLGNGGINVYARVGLDLIIDFNGYFDTGAAGPTGPTGPAGPAGATGPTGAAGTFSVASCTTVSSPEVFLTNSYTTIIATCPTGLTPVSGGYFSGSWNSANQCIPIDNQRFNNSWWVRWAAPSPTACAFNSTHTYVFCCP